MKKSILFLFSVLLLSAGTPALAQRGLAEKDPAQVAQERTERMKEVLPDLTEDQLKKLESMHLTMAGKRQALHQKAQDERALVRTQKKALRDEHQAALKEILTEEQFAKFEAHRAEKGPRKGHRKGQGKKGKCEKKCEKGDGPESPNTPEPKQ